MADFEKYCTSDIEENCECLDEISVSKSEEVVVDNEEVDVDKIIMMGFKNLRKKSDMTYGSMKRADLRIG
ncbi:hypothetical protein KY290_027170 [Solanum tuberosum]|uniref:Uncharacterized protein n=1 Tax=Solanum tuberosum TaxID=4113 RepID=A0ABQ7UG07_SOLTU|nr:hypothetical protein KY290_027170 [Solanum tuberosum]